MPFIQGYVRKLYHRFAKRYAYDDMLQEAFIAALLAEKRYDPEKGDFSSFIKKPIDGAVIRSVTTTTSKQQTLLLRVYKYVEEYSAEHSEIPSIEMALQHLKIDWIDYERAFHSAEHLYRVPIDEIVLESSDDPSEIEDLHDGIERLPKKYRRIMLNYLADKPYSESGYKTALKKLKEIMNG